MVVAVSSLERFHPVVADWFRHRFGKPTEIQEQAWKLIAAGEHCLISAATGSGKTLAAFLWGLNQLATGQWELGQTRALYISPLKALNNDIRRNLLVPLAELEQAFGVTGLDWPEIRVMTRSGDTEQAERRKMLRRPPEILITTPESLNLLLASKDGQRSLLGIKSVILDEIHSVVGSKRGVYLMTAIERLAHLNGAFQRIALSATVKPMETVAAFVGGFSEGRPRPVRLAQSSVEKRYEIAVRFPEDGAERTETEDVWDPVVRELTTLIEANRSTLIFVNSRMLCEKIAYKLNCDQAEPIAYAHHGSLSKEFRFAVEQRLKNGELRAIVATSSLEMGIDVGALDCVVMVQCPGAISSGVQKVGRAGHQVGAVSRAALFPSHARDFLESAVMAQAIRERDIETARPIEGPLDVLAQVVVATLGVGPWELDALYQLMRSSYPYRNLSRELFDLVVEMLAGRYEGSRLRELKPRLSINRIENTATLRKGALMAFYFSGGVIPDRGYFHLRLSGSGNRIGELDEEFVWERLEGDVFSLGVQSWRIEKITYNDVFVVPADKGEMAPPFWRSETYDRDFHFSNRIGEFLEWANVRVEQADFVRELGRRYAMDTGAAASLRAFLLRQKQFTGRDLPHRRHILAEVVDAAPSGAPGQQLVLHTHWGGRVNRPYALALDAAWFETFGHRTEVYVNNDCVVAMLSDEVAPEEALRLVTAGNVDAWLRRRLEGSGFFGARFREAAGTALLITRNKAGQRLPLWLSRMRAKKLYESVQRYDDFPLLLEAWRGCLRDAFDRESLQQVLSELEQGEIAVSFARGSVASPFAASVAWRQINEEYMYATDGAGASGESRLREDLVRAVAFDAENRPRVPVDVIRGFEEKRQRRAEGYAPTDAVELMEWLRDRIAIRKGEWVALCSKGEGDAIEVMEISSAEEGEPWLCLAEERGRATALFSESPDPDRFVEWLSYYGPVSEKWLQKIFPWTPQARVAVADALEDERRIVCGTLVEGSEERFLCEAENFEILLRLNRARNRPSFEPLPVEKIGLFLAEWQGAVRPGEGTEALQRTMDRMLGVALPVEEWEGQVFATRVAGYQSPLLDAALIEDGAIWYGDGAGRVGFCLEEDWPLLGVGGEGEAVDAEEEEDVEEVEEALATRVMEVLRTGGNYSFSKLMELLDCPAGELEICLWALVWAGRASNDAFAAARRGAMGKFSLCQAEGKLEFRSRARRPGRRARAVRPVTYPGNWYALEPPAGTGDAVECLEGEKERARIVLDRYGVVFRELLQREREGFRWRDVFKALRLLELSGEVVGGRFFEGVPGLQFVSKEALRRLRKDLPEESLYWIGAADPASVCGIGLEGLRGALPKRVASGRLVYRGAQLVAESRRGGKALRFHVAPEDADMDRIVAMLGAALDLGRVGQLKVEEINGSDARSSVYLPRLDAVWRLHRDHKQVVVEGIQS